MGLLPANKPLLEQAPPWGDGERLEGDLVNSGVVAQFNSPGTLTVVGNYTQNANGTLRIQVAGVGANQHDLVAVNGHANLAGTLQLVRVGNFTLQPGDQITFLTLKTGSLEISTTRKTGS